MPDSHEGTLTLHKECYVAVVPADALDSTVKRLRTLDVPDSAIDAFCGSGSEEEWRELSPQRIDDGSVRSAVRRMFGFDQVEIERTYAEALEAGRPVLRVRVPEDAEDTRVRVEETLLDHGAEYVHYFGSWSFAEVAKDAERGGQTR